MLIGLRVRQFLALGFLYFCMWRLARNRVIISSGFMGGVLFPAESSASALLVFSRLGLFSASHAV